MKLILKPLDESNDIVLIHDHHNTALAAVHIDTFLDGAERGPLYDALYRGNTVTVEVRQCTPTE
jgi:hypothetical protein